MENNYQDFDEFITWLKKDGLKPKTSERIWRKKIFTNLLNGHKRSVENYKDFFKNKKLRSLIGKKTSYKDFNKLVCSVNELHNIYVLTLEDMSIIKVKIKDLDEFIANCISWDKDE